jgi:hypothetical protein
MILGAMDQKLWVFEVFKRSLLVVACRLRVDAWLVSSRSFFYIFLYFFEFIFLEVWENGCTGPPFFEACPYTWKC